MPVLTINQLRKMSAAEIFRLQKHKSSLPYLLNIPTEQQSIVNEILIAYRQINELQNMDEDVAYAEIKSQAPSTTNSTSLLRLLESVVIDLYDSKSSNAESMQKNFQSQLDLLDPIELRKNLDSLIHLFKILQFCHVKAIDDEKLNAEDAYHNALQLLYAKIADQFCHMPTLVNGVGLANTFRTMPIDLQNHVAYVISTTKTIPDGVEIFANHIGTIAQLVKTDLQSDIEKYSDVLDLLSDKRASISEREINNHKLIAIARKLKSYNALNIPDENGFTVLLYASAGLNEDHIRFLLLNGADVNFLQGADNIIVLSYVLFQFLDIVNSPVAPIVEAAKLLLEFGANPVYNKTLWLVDEINCPELTALFASQKLVVDLQKLDSVLNSWDDASVDVLQTFDYKEVINGIFSSSGTPLIHAVIKNNAEAVKIFSKIESLKLNLTDEFGNSFLHYAAVSGSPAMISSCARFIWNKQSEPIRWHIANKSGVTPLYYALQYKNNDAIMLLQGQSSTAYAMEVIKYLIADNKPDQLKASALIARIFETDDYAKEKLDIYNFIDPESCHNILEYSIKHDDAISFSALISHRDLFDSPQISLNRALFVAIQYSRFDMVLKLIEAGADVNFMQQSYTALIYAVKYADKSVVELLLRNGARIDDVGQSNFTALSFSVLYGKEDTCEVLVRHNANKHMLNVYGDNALSIALRTGSHKIVTSLLDGKMEDAKYTELMIAIWGGDLVKADSLVKNAGYMRVNGDAVNAGGFSALMVAGSKYNSLDSSTIHGKQQKDTLLKLILQMIDSGVDISTVNKSGANFLQLARRGDMFDVSSPSLNHIYDLGTSEKFMKTHQGKSILHLSVQLDPMLMVDLLCDAEITAKAVNIINKLDADGNSPLSYLLFDTSISLNDVLIKRLVEDYGAKFIRNGKEIRSGLHLKILTSDPIKAHADINYYNSFFTDADIRNINFQDEQGYTPLHYACMQNKPDLASKLIELGADPCLKDNIGRIPLHYAVVNHFNLDDLPAEYNVYFKTTDMYGVTPLILAYQYPTELIHIQSILNRVIDEERPRLEKIFLLCVADINSGDLDAALNRIKNLDDSFSYKQRLVLLSASRHACELAGLDIKSFYSLIDNTAKLLLIRETAVDYRDYTFPEKFAIGLEIELPEWPDHALITRSDFLSWFPTIAVHDATVKRSALSLHTKNEGEYEDLELVSNIIQDSTQYQQFLLMCEILTENGAKVNRTAGMHVHVNCRGSESTNIKVAPLFATSDPRWQENEMVYVKYVLLNFISIEQLLRGFMREGVLFDEYGSSYVETISKYREQIIACDNLKDLQEKFCSHTKTIDLTALDKHGTIEFRVHEGMVDPVLINAWVECVTRLSTISYSQAIEHIKKQSQTKVIEPKAGIEQLVYLLIAQRNYSQTWDTDLAAPRSAQIRTASAYPGTNISPVQVQIQQSPLYQLLGVTLQYLNGDKRINSMDKLDDGFRVCMNSHVEFTDGRQKDSARNILNEVVLMVEFIRDNPGIILNKIDQSLDRTQQYNAVVELINSCAKDFGSSPGTRRVL